MNAHYMNDNYYVVTSSNGKKYEVVNRITGVTEATTKVLHEACMLAHYFDYYLQDDQWEKAVDAIIKGPTSLQEILGAVIKDKTTTLN